MNVIENAIANEIILATAAARASLSGPCKRYQVSQGLFAAWTLLGSFDTYAEAHAFKLGQKRVGNRVVIHDTYAEDTW